MGGLVAGSLQGVHKVDLPSLLPERIRRDDLDFEPIGIRHLFQPDRLKLLFPALSARFG